MHADVGGGYSQDGLSYVTLDWMMDRALVYRLRLKPQEVERLRHCANEYDKLNDSRHGLAGYYRYQPRKINVLRKGAPKWAKTGDDFSSLLTTIMHPAAHDVDSDVDDGLHAGSKYPPMIHESVFRRIRAGVDGYSPIGIPASYCVTTKNGQILSGQYESDSQAERRARRQEGRVWKWVWGRRVVYFATVLVSLVLAAMPLLLPKSPETGEASLVKWQANDEASWAAPLIPAINVAGRFLPSFAASWIDTFKQAPLWLLGGGLALAALLFLGGILQRRIHDRMRPLWRENLGPPPTVHLRRTSASVRRPVILSISSAH